MAQTGFTPILIYSSSTASQAPAAGNLTNSTSGSELAINITDGKLFYKDNANAVQVIGWKTTPTSAGGTGLTSFTAGDTLYYASGTTLSKLAIGASKTIMTSSGTAPQWSTSLDTTQGGTGLTSYTAGDLIYYSTGTTLSKLAIGANNYVLASNGSAPTWVAPSSLSIGTATNISGGAAGSLPYQSAASTTAMLAIGTAYYMLGVNAGGTAPSWQPSATSVLTTQGDLLYASAANTLARLAKNTTASRYLSNSGSSNNPAWAQVDLTNGVTGTLPTTNGGTGLASFTANQVFYASSTSAFAQSTNLQFNGTTLTVANDSSINGLTVGKGASAVSDNSAFGVSALAGITTGARNAGFGYVALQANQTGTDNTAVGRYALNACTSSANTAVGSAALYQATSGGTNTALGEGAGANLTTGGGNTFLGRNISASANNVSNEVVISHGGGSTGKGGSTGYINANGGGVYQGNNSASWSTTSDRRLKKNIVDNNDGLAKINLIRVRNFEYRLPDEVDPELKSSDAINKAGIQLGVIAQELQAVLPECVKQESTGVLSVDPDNLTWYLVNAIKQLDTKIEVLQSELNALKGN